MKALKIFMVVMIAIAFIVPMTVSDSQAAAWYTCWVNKIGQEPGTASNILLTETSPTPAFSSKWYQLDATNKAILQSIALTAMASGMKVGAYCSGTNGGTCTGLYLYDQ